MKKSIKFVSMRLLAVVLAVALLIPATVIGTSAAILADVVTSSTLSSNSNVAYAKYSSSNANVYTLEFNPTTTDLMPMGYVTWAGSTDQVSDTVADAIANGYDVHGAINGEFFAMNVGTLTGKLIANGRILSDHETNDEYNFAIDKDGGFQFVQSELAYHFYVEGEEVGAAAIGRINKPYYGDGWLYDPICYFDSACGTKTDTVSSYPGVEVVFNKLNGSELIVEGVLEGEVVSVNTNTYGTTFSDNQFVLYANPDSPYASTLSSLTAGTNVQIYAQELYSDSKEIMKSANTVMSATYPVVQNGQNVTSSTPVNASGGLSKTERAQRTAIGIKEDGSYVYFVSSGRNYNSGDGDGLTISEVADAMIELGCTFAVNLDGGGSSGLYADGEYKYYSEDRAVSSVMLIVSRNEAVASSTKKQAVNDWIYNANTTSYETSEQQAAVAAAVAKAEAVYNDSKATNGEYTRAVMDIRVAMGLVEDVLPLPYISLKAEDWAPQDTMKLSNDASGALILQNTDGLWPKATLPLDMIVSMDDYISYDITVNGGSSINFTINAQEFKLNPSITSSVDSSSGDIVGNGQTFKGVIKVSDLVGITDAMKNADGNLPISELYVFATGTAGSGSQVTIRELTVISAYSKGDVNGDAVVNSTDARMIVRSLAGLISLSSEASVAADYNGDGTVDTNDVRQILRASIGL